MPRRILFVDDEPNLLMGLQRTLRPKRAVWEMEFATSGEQALRLMQERPFDAVVTDMRMPGMSGAELLDTIQEQYPQTVRIVLSGQADRESILRAVAPAHQFLSKPCDPEQLSSILEKTLVLADLLQNPSLKCFISRLKSIPSLPSLYQRVTTELRSEDPSPSRLSEIIASDMAMTAKLLQMVNSAAFGGCVQVSEAKQAVLLLGLDTIQALVLSLGIFSTFDPHLLGSDQTECLWKHSIQVSRMSRAIAESEGIVGRELAPYQSAGLLHDIGKLVMASASPREYRRVVDLAASTQTDLCAAEVEQFGCTHAQVGAYLLGVWGLPSAIVEAVAWSHCPVDSPVKEFSPLTTVHVASAFDTLWHPDRICMDSHVDQEFLERIGLSERQELWMQCCEARTLEGWE